LFTLTTVLLIVVGNEGKINRTVVSDDIIGPEQNDLMKYMREKERTCAGEMRK